MKKVIAMISVFCLTVACRTGVCAAQQNETIRISTADELVQELSGKEVTGTVELLDDIDMSGREFQPIAKLTGTLEGNGHTVSGLKIACEGSISYSWSGDASYKGAGFIARLNGEVKNTVLKDLKVVYTYTNDYNSFGYCGGIVGYVGEGEKAWLENCAVVGDSAVEIFAKKEVCCGGLLGYASMDAEVNINRCFSTAKVSCPGYAGGLAGCFAFCNADIRDSYSLGEIEGNDTCASSGMVGWLNSLNKEGQTVAFTNCFFGGTLKSLNKYRFAKCVSCEEANLPVKNCCYDSEKNKIEISDFAGEERYVDKNVTGKATEEFRTLAGTLGESFTDDADTGYPTLKWAKKPGGGEDRVEFQPEVGGNIRARLVFELSSRPAKEDICVYIAYRSAGELRLREVCVPELDETLSFDVPVREGAEMSVYVWDKAMRPLMSVQTPSENAIS